MKRYKIIIDRFNEDISNRLYSFIDEVSHLGGVEIDKESLSLLFDDEIEDDILVLAKQHGIVFLK